jgi:hypothetical protein
MEGIHNNDSVKTQAFFIGESGRHVIAEIFVNKNIGNNPIYRDLFEKKIPKKS